MPLHAPILPHSEDVLEAKIPSYYASTTSDDDDKESLIKVTERQREKHRQMAAQFSVSGEAAECKSDLKGILKDTKVYSEPPSEGSVAAAYNFASIRSVRAGNNSNKKDGNAEQESLLRKAAAARRRQRSESDIMATMERERRRKTEGLVGAGAPMQPRFERTYTVDETMENNNGGRGRSPGRSASEWILTPGGQYHIYEVAGRKMGGEGGGEVKADPAMKAKRSDRPKDTPPPPPPQSSAAGGNKNAAKGGVGAGVEQHYYSSSPAEKVTSSDSNSGNGNNNSRKGSLFVQKRPNRNAVANNPRGSAARRASLANFNQQQQQPQQQQQQSRLNGGNSRLSGSALVLTSPSSSSSSSDSSSSKNRKSSAGVSSSSSSSKRPWSRSRREYEESDTLQMHQRANHHDNHRRHNPKVRHARSAGDIVEELRKRDREVSPKQTVTITVNMAQQQQQNRRPQQQQQTKREDSSSTTMSMLSNMTAAGVGQQQQQQQQQQQRRQQQHQQQLPQLPRRTIHRVPSNSSDYNTDSTNSSYQPVDRRPHKMAQNKPKITSKQPKPPSDKSSSSASSLYDLTYNSRQLAHASSSDILNHALLTPQHDSSSSAGVSAVPIVDQDHFRRTRDFGDFQILTNSPAVHSPTTNNQQQPSRTRKPKEVAV